MAKSKRKSKRVARAPARATKESTRHPLLGGPMLARDETTRFIFVNVLDYFMTYVILYYSHMQGSPLRQRLMESNPVAAYFINHWGLVKGMLGFKLGLVIFVCIVTQAIAYKQEETARRVLNLGSVLVGCVVIYSLWLLVRAM